MCLFNSNGPRSERILSVGPENNFRTVVVLCAVQIASEIKHTGDLLYRIAAGFRTLKSIDFDFIAYKKYTDLAAVPK